MAAPVPLYPADTTPEAGRAHTEALRRMTAGQRLAMAAQLTDQVRAAAAAGVRLRHPEYDDERVRRAVARLVLGDRLFHRAGGGPP